MLKPLQTWKQVKSLAAEEATTARQAGCLGWGGHAATQHEGVIDHSSE